MCKKRGEEKKRIAAAAVQSKLGGGGSIAASVGVSPWDVGTGVRRAADVERVTAEREKKVSTTPLLLLLLDIASE